MLTDHRQLIRREVEDGTGAEVGLEPVNDGAQAGLKLWFQDLGRPRSPIVELRPIGLKRYSARLSFGRLAGETVSQMQRAGEEERQLARALIRTVAQSAAVDVSGQSIDDWTINGGDFEISAEIRGVENRFADDALISTCRTMVTPMLAAMAELYGYVPVLDAEESRDALMEGAVRLSTVRRRERNPRNRLLCLRIHGSNCMVCGLDPALRYGDAGAIIEVHHIQPLSSAAGERLYDPETDLIPLCPSCHRAAHTRRPMPWSPDELRGKLEPQ